MRVMVIIAFLIISQLSKADVSTSETDDGYVRIIVSGTITSSDYSALVEKHSIFKRERRATSFVFLNSAGGDVNTAIKIGRYLRKQELFAVVHDGSICASACVFILAGAISRSVEGRVFIHRPFINDDKETSPVKQKLQYKKLEKLIKVYLEDVNVSSSLYDDMFAVDSSNSKLLSPEDLSKYKLVGLDPYKSEANDAALAKEYGITKIQLHERRNRFRGLCSNEITLFDYAMMNSTDKELKHKLALNVDECEVRVYRGELK